MSDTKQEWNKGAILRAKGGVHPTGPECVTLALVAGWEECDAPLTQVVELLRTILGTQAVCSPKPWGPGT